jgi:hypothetical protein
MEPNFNGTLNTRLKWNKIKQYDEKTKDSDLPCHTIDPWGRGTMVLDRSIGAIGRNSRRRHCRARSAQWHAGDLYRLFFIGSSWRKLADTKYDWYRLA